MDGYDEFGQQLYTLMSDSLVGDDVSMILGVLHVYGDQGMAEKFAFEHLPPQSLELLLSRSIIYKESLHLYLSQPARDFLAKYLSPQRALGALDPKENDDLSAIEREDIVRLREICATSGEVGSFAEMFFVALVETQLSTLRDARVARVIERTPTQVKDDVWTLLHDAGFIDPVDEYWVVTQRGLTAYFNFTH